MNQQVIRVLEDIGFKLQNDWGRAIHAMLQIKGSDCFSLFLDTKLRVISLKCCIGPIEQYILFRQGYNDETDLKALLLKNQVLIPYLPDSVPPCP